jgi:hypothetical protein
MANMPFFRGIYRAKRAASATASRGAMIASRVPAWHTPQQPWQIFFSRAFIRPSSSLLILSTYFAACAFEAGASGFAVADEAAMALS